MRPPSASVRRQVLGFLAWGTAIACLPVGVSAAWANDEDNGGRGRGRGHGRGRGGDRDNGQDRQTDGDRGGSGSNSSDSHGRTRSEDQNGRRGSTADGVDDSGRQTLRDITVSYPDGWTERIADGSYELTDPQSRLVVRRSASIEDFERMSAVR